MSALNSFVTRPGARQVTEPLNDRQAKNNAGGFVFQVSPLERIKRFLILGSESSYYQPGAQLTKENAQTIIDAVSAADEAGQRELIDLIVKVSVEGRAPKQQPALFALALVISQSTFDSVKNYGYMQVNKVCRTGTTLFEFFSFLNQFQRFGMGARKAIDRWYGSRTTEQNAYQMAKYRNRAGFTHADLLRLSKRVCSERDGLGPEAAALLNWAVGKPFDFDALPLVIRGLEFVKRPDADVASAVYSYGLSWEMLPTEALTDPKVWMALLDSGNLPYGALVRNLGRLSRLLDGNQRRMNEIAARLRDPDEIRRSRMHPMNLLIALKTYQQGHALRGSDSWVVQPVIAQALEESFYLAFGNVEPTGKRLMYALDVSGSMTWGSVGGIPITPAEAVTALTLVNLNVELDTTVVGFSNDVVPLPVRPHMRLKDAMQAVYDRAFGATNAGAAIQYAITNRLEIDTFVVMTDNEVWRGTHVTEELERYRRQSGIDAKLIVCATSASNFSIADPQDPLQLDCAGFDTATPQVISAFARGL